MARVPLSRLKLLALLRDQPYALLHKRGVRLRADAVYQQFYDKSHQMLWTEPQVKKTLRVDRGVSGQKDP